MSAWVEAAGPAARARTRPRVGPATLLGAIMLLGAALRLYHIGHDSYWRNELFTLFWIRNPLAFLLGHGLFVETNPPLHFVLLKLWAGLFGPSEVATRSLSALASLAAIGLVYRLGAVLAGARGGLIAALLVALAPMQIAAAQEARVYAFLPGLVAFTLLGAVRLLGEDAGWRRGLAAYTVGAVLLLWSHATAAIILAALGLCVLASLILGRRERVWPFIGASLLACLLAAPVAAGMAMQLGSPDIAWMPPFGATTVLMVCRDLIVGPLLRGDLGPSLSAAWLGLELLLSLGGVVLLLLLAPRAMGGSAAFRLLIVFPLLFLALAALISVARPILEPRIVLWMQVPLAVAAALILDAPAIRPWLRHGLAGVLAAGIAIGLCNNVFLPSQHKPDWRGFARDHDLTRDSGAMAVAGPHAGVLGFAFYAGGTVRRPVGLWMPRPEPVGTSGDLVARAALPFQTLSTDALVARIRAGHGVVLALDDGDRRFAAGLIARVPPRAERAYDGLLVLRW
ncbi:MAG: glycosyltransferase family 39 protein [Rhodospirillales bacterium]|nr:glycosyltransferase family 39 protein [Rhodospirillales bacterium]